MKKRFASLFAVAAIVGLTVGLPAAAQEAGGTTPTEFPIKKPPLMKWSFAGFFGKFDQAQLQRGYQVYKEVCSACHSMNLVAFRNLADPGGPHFSEAEVKALAASFQITDGPNDAGDMFQRPGKPYDHFPAPFPNPEAAAAANGGAAPPDLSVIAKARAVKRGLLWGLLDFFTGYQEAGPDYIHALLTGFQDPPPGVTDSRGDLLQPLFPCLRFAEDAAAAFRRAGDLQRRFAGDGQPVRHRRRRLPDVDG